MVITSSGITSPTHGRPGGLPRTTAEDSGTSFASQLAVALEKYLALSDNGSRIEIGIESAQASASGIRQFIVTVKDTAVSSTTVADTPKEAVEGTPAPEIEREESHAMMYSGRVAYDPNRAPVVNHAPQTVDDAYWAMQPAEVRQLRTISDPVERGLKAQELAAAGFAIDLPIMVWRWDPLMTMRARETAGYTWVPSANQAPVELPPGIGFPGLAEYDPADPPAGSIPVSTEWAKGLEHTSPWWRPEVVEGAGDAASA